MWNEHSVYVYSALVAAFVPMLMYAVLVIRRYYLKRFRQHD